MKLSLKIFILIVFLGLISCSDGAKADKHISETKDSLIDSTAFMVSDSVPSYIYPVDTVLVGDLNNDKINDTVFINEPCIIEEELSCRDDMCLTTFFFSDKSISSFKQEQALGGYLANAGDLDNDGICELVFVPDWFTSNWTGLNIYSLKNNNWILLGSGSIRRENYEMESDLSLAYQKRIIKHKDHFEILENVMDEEGGEKLVPKKIYFSTTK
ncbi:MAG: hypothetical protein Q8M29_03160 [Bacteroidota bacterium]|nr:hypothetical protein [Bacteroidota bacterium]